MRITMLVLAAALVWGAGLSAQAAPLSFAHEGWLLQGPDVRVDDVLGTEALRVGNGSAARVDLPVEDGVFEFDVALPRVRGFVGLRFRMDALGNAEEIYFRSHKSGFPDALQYAPVFAGESYWQVFHGPASTASAVFPAGEWLHVRLEVRGSVATVFLDGREDPALVARLARTPVPGYFAFYAGFPTPAGGDGPTAAFAHLEVSAERPPDRGLAPPPERHRPDGVVTRWELSPTFAWTGGLPTRLPDGMAATGDWVEAAAEPEGYVLVGRYRQRMPGGASTGVVARLRVTSETAGTRRLDLGFTDAAGVFLNGRLVYAADHSFSENFPRREGLVTLDQAALFLPLEEGENEVLVMVVDAMGGWAVGGALNDASGLTIH